MRIGLLRRYTHDLPDYLRATGFTCAEIEFRAGDPLDPEVASFDDVRSAFDKLAANRVRVSSLASYENLLDPDPAKAAAATRRLRKVIQWASKLGIEVIGIMAGRDPGKPLMANIAPFKKAFTPIVREAEELGLKLAIENCPKFHAFPFRGSNIGYSVEAFDAIFDAVPSKSLGIEYDPSHPIMMFMDYLDWIYRYADRIFHVHAKDAEVVWREIKTNGIYADKAFRYRLPGLGDVEWGRFISALIEIGYRGDIDIEGRHDPVYMGELETAGLLLAKKHLEQFIPAESAVLVAQPA